MTKNWLFFLSIPFAAFAMAFVAGAVTLRHLLKRAKVSMSDTRAGKGLHVETSFATLDMHPDEKLDARLAQIPVYPGALPENAVGPQSTTEMTVGGRTFRDVSATYWTPDSDKQVWDFYRQQLPDWPRNLVETQGGKELIRDAAQYVLLVRISKDRDRTVIETCVKPAGYPHQFERRYMAKA
jgi:hypothetical protein